METSNDVTKQEWWSPVNVWERKKILYTPMKSRTSVNKLGHYYVGTKPFYIYKYVKTGKMAKFPSSSEELEVSKYDPSNEKNVLDVKIETTYKTSDSDGDEKNTSYSRNNQEEELLDTDMTASQSLEDNSDGKKTKRTRIEQEDKDMSSCDDDNVYRGTIK